MLPLIFRFRKQSALRSTKRMKSWRGGEGSVSRCGSVFSGQCEGHLSEVLAPDNVCCLSALKDRNSKELDYHIEAGNLEGMTKNTTMGGFLTKEVVPPPTR